MAASGRAAAPARSGRGCASGAEQPAPVQAGRRHAARAAGRPGPRSLGRSLVARSFGRSPASPRCRRPGGGQRFPAAGLPATTVRLHGPGAGGGRSGGRGGIGAAVPALAGGMAGPAALPDARASAGGAAGADRSGGRSRLRLGRGSDPPGPEPWTGGVGWAAPAPLAGTHPAPAAPPGDRWPGERVGERTALAAGRQPFHTVQATGDPFHGLGRGGELQRARLRWPCPLARWRLCMGLHRIRSPGPAGQGAPAAGERPDRNLGPRFGQLRLPLAPLVCGCVPAAAHKGVGGGPQRRRPAPLGGASRCSQSPGQGE